MVCAQQEAAEQAQRQLEQQQAEIESERATLKVSLLWVDLDNPVRLLWRLA